MILGGVGEPGRDYPLTTDFSDDGNYPYFLWDDPMTVAELKFRLKTLSESERLALLGKVLREARNTDVWFFTTPQEVLRLWPKLERHLGRRRGFWVWLLGVWRELGLVHA